MNNNEIDKLVIGNIYTNKDIANTFKCSNMGGMRRSKATNSLVLITKLISNTNTTIFLKIEFFNSIKLLITHLPREK